MARKKPIISPLGQWAYPGEVTIIPSSNITMKGVNYPVLGIDDLGNQQMMMPGQDYTFPGDYVTEIPQMGKGGLRQWFDEKWVDVKTGKACGRSGKDKDGRPYPACRPSKRVNETTPKTTSEMSSSEKARFKREKTSGKRINYNHKRREEGGETGWLDQYQTGGEDIQKRLNRYMAQDNNRSYAMPNGLSFNTGLREIQQEYLNQNFPTDKLGDLSPQVLEALRNSAKNLKLDYSSSLNLPEKLGNIGYKSSYSLATPKSTKDLLTDLTYTKSFPGGNFRATTDSQQLNLKSKGSNLNIGRSIKDSKVSNQFNFNTKVLGDALNVYGAGQFNPNDVLTVKGIDPLEAKTNIKGNIGVRGTTKNLDYNVKGNYNPKTGLNYQGDAVLRMFKDRLNVSGSATTKDQLLDAYNLDANLKLGKNLNLSAFRKNEDDETSYGAGVKGNLGPINLSGNVNYNSNAMRNYNIAADVDLLRSTRENPNRGNLNLSGNYGASMDEMGTMSPNYGLNLKYTNSFEEGGWLDEYQTGGWASWTPNVGKPYMRTSPAGNTGYSDNTRVVNQNTNVSAANRKAAEAAEYAKRVGSVSQGEAKSAYEKAREASSFVSQAERRKGSADPLDYVLDVFNPAAIGFAGVDLSNNLGSAVSNTAQGNFAEAGSDLLGAGLNALQIIPAAAEFKGIVKPLSKFARLTPGQYKVAQQFANNPEKAIPQAVSYASKLAQSQINKNPRLALSLQRGRPISLDNVNTVSGIRYGDVSSVPNFNKIKPNTISEGAFFKQLEKGADSLDNSLQKRVADLESEEGFRRLVDQEKDYLFYNSDLEEDALERVAKINARARIDELKNTTNLNKEAAEFASTNFLNAGIPNRFVETSQLYDNAFRGAGYDDVLSNMLSKRQGINLVKATPNYSKSVPGEIGIGYNYVGNKPIEMHEIAHSLQRGRRLNVDDQLRNIVPKKELTRDQKHAYEYFSKGSHRQEPSAFANELRESMLQSGIIPDYYSPISQQQIQDAYKYFKTKPMGTYNKNTGNFLSSTRILDFMAPNQSNSKLLSNILNRLPTVAPLAIGTAAASQLPEQKNGGWLNNYQDGGENLPELNSKIDIANFYKNPLSEKYGIYQDPEDDTYKYYLKSGDESSILQSGPDLSNINSRRLAEINSQKGSLSNAQLANIKNVSPVILPEQKQRILRDKVYYDQEDLMEQAMSESSIPSVKTPSYSEILESDPEFKRVMTEKPKPVAPIKPKPVATNTPLVPIGNAPRAITRPAVRKVVAKNDIVNLADLTITAADKAYLNKVEEYCPGGNCLETTRNAYDMLPGRIQGIPTSSDIWSNDLKIHSKKGTPTANDIKQYPYFAGDSGSGTVDSWDIHGVIVANGGKNLFNINNPTPIDYKQIPVGAVIGWGPANKKDSSYSGRSKGYNKQFGMQPSHHSTMVTGYSETGEPIVYDGFLKKYMTLTEAKANIGSSLSYELENISAPKSILNNTQDNLRSQGVLLNYIPPTNVNPNKILAAANQPWAQIPEGSAKRAPRFNKQMMTEFNSALMNNKGELMRNLNISSEKYDELAKVALAISAQESEGGGALGIIDGSTIGMTQLNPDNIFKDDKLKKAASKPYILNDGGNNILKPELIKTPSGSAVATMIYLSKLDKDSERYYNEGKVPKDRSFTKNSNIIKDALRSNTSKYNADGFFVEEANKRIDLSPFEGGMLSSPDPVAAQKLLNKTAGAADKYKVSVKNGSLVVTMKTKGNADLSVAERIGYAWQSPNTLKSGDAQGDSVYTRRIKNYYDLLNNTTPTYRKEGGQTGWLNKYK